MTSSVELKLFFLPFMHPGNLSFMASSKSDLAIQYPNCPLTPSFGVVKVSFLFSDMITVLLSTRATSFGSVLANQLQIKNK